MKAVLCPICNGKGTLCDHGVNTPLALHPTCPTCHGCGGKGWVEVSEELPINYPCQPYYPYYPYYPTYPYG